MVSSKLDSRTVKANLGANGSGKVDREKAVDQALSQVEKQFGKGAIMRLGESQVVEIDAISTGCLSMDIALGIGGVPRGRIIEMFGPESAGKTMCALNMVAQAQKNGGIAAFVDAEHALDVGFARKLGVDVENLLVAQPDCGEEALEITDTLVRSAALDIIVIDSVAALVPRAELEGEMGDAQMGLQARLMSQAMRKLTGSIQKSRTTVIFINQLRMKIGVMFGNPETTTGGRALCFYASVRMDIRAIGNIKDGDEVIGRRTRVKVVKNKVAPPFKEAEFDVLFRGDDVGISKEGDLLDLGVNNNVIEKSGTWFSYGDERIGQGRENARIYLKENQDTAKRIETEIRKALDIPLKGQAADAEAAAAKAESEVVPAAAEAGKEPTSSTKTAAAASSSPKAAAEKKGKAAA
jgi:recombination protein RecA